MRILTIPLSRTDEGAPPVPALRLDPDRAPACRAGDARRSPAGSTAQTRDLPLVCMHGHVDAAVLADDLPFADPAQLLVVPDHYVTRMLVSQGIRSWRRWECRRATARPAETDPRRIWRLFCANWHLFRGTPTRFWLEHELVEVFGVDGAAVRRDAPTSIYDEIARASGRARLPAAGAARPVRHRGARHHRLRRLSDLADHAAAARRRSGAGPGGADVPAGRAACTSTDAGWGADVARLGRAHRHRHRRLRRLPRRAAPASAARSSLRGAGHRPRPPRRPTPLRCRRAEAARIYAATPSAGRRRRPADAAAFAGHMLFEMAGDVRARTAWSCSCTRACCGTTTPASRAPYGPDVGFDIPVAAEFTRALRPLLERFGHDPRLRLVAVHGGRDAPTPASSPRWPAPTRRCGSARRGGSWTRPTGCAGSGSR